MARQPKLTPPEMDEVRRALEGGEPVAEVSHRYGVSRKTLYEWIKRLKWEVAAEEAVKEKTRKLLAERAAAPKLKGDAKGNTKGDVGNAVTVAVDAVTAEAIRRADAIEAHQVAWDDVEQARARAIKAGAEAANEADMRMAMLHVEFFKKLAEGVAVQQKSEKLAKRIDLTPAKAEQKDPEAEARKEKLVEGIKAFLAKAAGAAQPMKDITPVGNA